MIEVKTQLVSNLVFIAGAEGGEILRRSLAHEGAVLVPGGVLGDHGEHRHAGVRVLLQVPDTPTLGAGPLLARVVRGVGGHVAGGGVGPGHVADRALVHVLLQPRPRGPDDGDLVIMMMIMKMMMIMMIMMMETWCWF